MDSASTHGDRGARTRPGRLVLALTAVLLAYSFIALPPAWYVPGNLAAAGLLWLGVRRVGLTSTDLGVERAHVATGLRLGLVVGTMAVAVIALGAALPLTRPLFDDARVGDIGWEILVYRMFVRIPLGTVLLEELAFRGALFGAWRRWQGQWPAILGSSLVFGLWHVRPALELLDANDLAAQGPGRVLAVVGAVAGTWIGGIFFCMLRTRSDSLAAPVVVHAAVNSSATLAAFWVS